MPETLQQKIDRQKAVALATNEAIIAWLNEQECTYCGYYGSPRALRVVDREKEIVYSMKQMRKLCGVAPNVSPVLRKFSVVCCNCCAEYGFGDVRNT